MMRIGILSLLIALATSANHTWADTHPASAAAVVAHSATAPDSIGDLPATKPVTLATFEYPPYIETRQGRASGPLVDIVEEVFRRLHQRVTIKLYPWARGVGLVKAGEVDGFFTMKKRPGRDAFFYYPHHPLIRQEYQFFVRKGSTLRFSGQFAPLANATIGVVPSNSYGERFDQAAAAGRFHALDFATTHELNFRKLIAGHVDTVICSRLVGFSILKKLHALDQIVTMGPPASFADSYIVFARVPRHIETTHRIDAVIASMESDGTLTRILTAYGLETSIPSFN